MDLYTNIDSQGCEYDHGQDGCRLSGHDRCNGWQSHFPDRGQYPEAMAYVPWQQWQHTYPPDQGIVRGTIFPDLDLPFNGGRCGR